MHLRARLQLAVIIYHSSRTFRDYAFLIYASALDASTIL
jgi:hypothetical protein